MYIYIHIHTYYTIQYNTIQHNTTQHNTIHYIYIPMYIHMYIYTWLYMQIVSLKWTYNFNQQWSNQWIDLKFKGHYTGNHWFFNHKDREQPQFVPSNSGIKPWTLASRCCCWNGHWQNAFHDNDDMTIDSWVCLKLGYPIIPFIIMLISNVLQIWGYCYSPIFKHTHSILLCTCATRSHYIPTWL